VAQGGEQYLTIGNFKDGTHLKKTSINNNFIPGGCALISNPRAYMLIDDVSLYELPNLTTTQSYTLCAGDSLLLGDTVSLPVRYQWSLNGVVVDTTKNITITNAGIYILQTKHCTTQTQTITVVVDDGCNPPLETEPVIPNVFTPNGDNVNDSFEFLVLNVEYAEFKIYNRWGNIIKNLELNTKNYISWDGRTTSGEAVSDGTYFYILEYKTSSGDKITKRGCVSLFR
jgi:gliding motility-associated-like protein